MESFKSFNNKNNQIVYCDMDGVLVNFWSGIRPILPHLIPDDIHENLISEEKFVHFSASDWKKMDATPNFWLNMKPMSDMEILWNKLKPYSPVILTAAGGSYEKAKREKVSWCKKHLNLDPSKIIVVEHSSYKKQYAKQKSGIKNFLIDDITKNIEEWNTAGGIGIVHNNANATIRKLNALGFK